MTILNSGRINRRGFMATTAGAALIAGLPLRAKAAPSRGGHLRAAIGHGQTTDTLDPGTWSNSFTTSLGFAIHGRLTEVAADGSLIPEVAESWEASADASVWRFKLRSGVAFHSGKSLTAADVVNSINFHRGENSTSAAGPLVAPVTDITTEGDDIVVFTLDGGNADFPYFLSDYHLVICKAEGESIDWKSGDGCGSYVLKDFNPGVSYALERNPNHWRSDVAWFDTAEVLAIVDQNARTTALVSGDVDVVDRLDLKTVGLLARNPNIQINSVAGTQHFTFAMDTRAEPYNNPDVRLALKYGINRQELVDKILFGYGSIGNDHPIGRGQRFFNTELEQKSFDPDKAKFHLKQAGLDSLEVKLSAADAAFGGAVDAAVLYQSSAAQAGITLTPVREANDGYWSDVWMKKPFSAVYWSGRPVEDQMFATAYKCGAAWNDTFWCNDRFDELMLKARSELDEDKRREMYFEMQAICSDDGGQIVPMFANYVFGNSNKIAHSDTLGANWDVDGMRFIERWWMA
ncbi:Twin-arginine translocation pathway signal [Roseovarius sp. EC-HK134]|jgi:peptide/nickel transport system substrate-binding protein|uniref:ABC transporter substrate-binding protein n=1 Tax=Roseovarius TaxID=74030 RepID=UPI00125B6697|nr:MULTISPECIES: ABC transporter substrate-binding protein [Roseovarius]MBW4975711.1 ABC transporter substrate-binding protein [Roseovarius mucosus]VVT21570.1 Twin-arginine translocation pathway signal [Roseovarius sp. EC-SD190]VVT21644.1 Twin-arginine translocation pathway signal [Roseovarius sp. EC-HK134]